jgi:alkane 1-monooxygenase
VLRHFDESPQLPFGYPASILLSLIPPFWFKMMNPRVKQINN